MYPGDYTLDTTNGLEKHNNVNIVSNGSKDLSIRVLSTELRSLSENDCPSDCPFDLNVTVVNPSLTLTCPQECTLIFTAYITNHCNPTESIEWKSDINVYLNSLFITLAYQTCDMYGVINCINGSFYLDLSQYSIFSNGTNPIELTLNISSIVASTSITVNVTVACQEPSVIIDGYCSYATCDNQNYCPLHQQDLI